MGNDDFTDKERLGMAVVEQIYLQLSRIKDAKSTMPMAVAVSIEGEVAIWDINNKIQGKGFPIDAYRNRDWEPFCKRLVYGLKVYTDKRLKGPEIRITDDLPVWRIDYEHRIEHLTDRGRYKRPDKRPDEFHDWHASSPIIFNVPQDKVSVTPPSWLYRTRVGAAAT